MTREQQDIADKQRLADLLQSCQSQPPSWPLEPKVILPPSLYDAAQAQGFDMRWYVKSKPLPSNAGD